MNTKKIQMDRITFQKAGSDLCMFLTLSTSNELLFFYKTV